MERWGGATIFGEGVLPRQAGGKLDYDYLCLLGFCEATRMKIPI